MSSNTKTFASHYDPYSEAAELRRLDYLDKVMRGEIYIPGVPVLPGYKARK